MCRRVKDLTRLAVPIAAVLSLGCGQSPSGPSDVLPGTLAVFSISPSSGTIRGGTVIGITGRAFGDGVRVTIDGLNATVRSATSTFISVDAPPHAAGPVDVVVTNPGGATVTSPVRFSYVGAPLEVFRESATGFETTELRGAQDRVVELDRDGFLRFAESGLSVGGFRRQGDTFFVTTNTACDCALEVRFGSQDGARRAYLTADYGHFNPGTLVGVEAVDGRLVVTKTDEYLPGTFALSGLVTEVLGSGEVVAVDGGFLSVAVGGGHRETSTDRNGAFTIPGLSIGVYSVGVGKPGFEGQVHSVRIDADTQFDARLVRR